MNLVDVYTIQEMRHRSSDAVPLCSLVGKHTEMGVNDKIDDIIGCRALETLAEPIDCHLSRCHRVKHEVLQVLQSLGIGECGFVHVSTIHGFECCAYFVCHLVNWLGRLTSCLYKLMQCFNTTNQKKCGLVSCSNPGTYGS